MLRSVKGVYRSLIAICFAATLYYGVAHWCLQWWLDETTRSIVTEANAKTRKEEILALRDHVRKTVHSYELDMNHDTRPFLRDDARTTLETHKGYCGEAARAFVCLAHQRGIAAQRTNLYGRMQHVVAVVENGQGDWIIVDTQPVEGLHGLLDEKEWTPEALVADPRSPFSEFSHLNLRRIPGAGQMVRQVKLDAPIFSWALENPPLVQALAWGGAGMGLTLVWGLHRVLVRLYARRLGVPWNTPAKVGKAPPKEAAAA